MILSLAGTANELMGLLAELDTEQRTCVVEVRHPDETEPALVHLRKGQIVAVEPWPSDEEWILGEYLARTEVVGPGPLARAMRRAVKQDREAAELLMEARAVPEDILRRFADLEQRERLFTLLRRSGTSVEAVDQRPRSSTYAPPLSIPFVMKEGRRQLDAWSRLRRTIGRPEAVYRREVEILSEVLGYDGPAPGEEPLPELSANARMSYFFIDGNRTITQIARTSGLAVFDVYLALQELLESHLVTLVTTHSKGEVLAVRGPMLPVLVSGLTSLVLIACVALGSQWVYDNQAMLRSSLSATSPSVAATVDRANRRHIEQALRLYELHHRTFPPGLEALVEAGYVNAQAQRSFRGLRYEPTPVGYILTSRQMEPR